MIHSRGERIRVAWVALGGGAERDRKWKGIDRSETRKKGIGNEWKKCVGDSQRAYGKKTEFLKVKPGEQNENLGSVQGSDDNHERDG